MNTAARVLAALLVVWFVASLLQKDAPSARARAAALGAESLARDFDLLLTDEDSSRAEVTGPLWVRRSEDRVVPMGASFALSVIGAPLALLLDRQLLEAALCVLEMALLVLALLWVERRLSDASRPTAHWLAALLFGSSAWLFAGAGGDLLLFAAALVAGAHCLPKHEDTAEDVYDDAEEVSWAEALPIGLPLGVVLFEQSVHAALLVPLAFAVPVLWRARVAGVLAGTLLALTGLWFAASGAPPWSGEVAWLGELEQVAGSEPAELGRDVTARWQGASGFGTWLQVLLHFVAGAHVGLLVGALPLFCLLMWSWGRDRAVRGIGLWFALAVSILLATRPFDVAGGPDSVGNRLLLPAIAFLGVLAAHRASLRASLLVVVVAQLLQWPVSVERWTSVSASLSARQVLPLETTQSLVGAGEGVLLPGGLWVRPWQEGALRLRGGVWNEVSIARLAPLQDVVLELGRGAPSQVSVRGAATEELMFRPDDSIEIQLVFDARNRRHSTWWSDDPVTWYRLRIRPEADGTWGFSMRPGRLR
ncbi:MAG: hypothetical protein AAF690_21205 [Acidobacteriota bacterium]